MKTAFKITGAAIAVAVLAVSSAYASGGSTSLPSISATATATVVQPVLITQNTGLDFGTFAVSPTTGGTIDSSGNVTGGVNLVAAGNPASFTTTGASGNTYTIVGDSSVKLTGVTSSVNSMTAALTYPPSPRTLTGGTDTFQASGVLTVNAGQVPDTYNGTYTVSVHY